MMLSIKMAAKRLGVDYQTFHKILKDGGLTYYVFRPKVWRIKEEDLENYISQSAKKNEKQTI